MAKEPRPRREEVEFLFGLFAEGYKDSDVLTKYTELQYAGSLVFPYRTDVRLIRELRGEFEAARTVLEPRIKRQIDPVVQKAWVDHRDELVRTASTLAHQCQRLLRYKAHGDIEGVGDILGHLWFRRMSNNTMVEEGAGSGTELTYEDRHPIDPYLAGLVYAHYEGQFGTPPFSAWNQVSTGSVGADIVDNLRLLAHGGVERCPKCPICLKLGATSP
jgi:hypothetical protein